MGNGESKFPKRRKATIGNKKVIAIKQHSFLAKKNKKELFEKIKNNLVKDNL